MRDATARTVYRALRRLVGPVCAVLVCVLVLVFGAPAARAQDDCEPQWVQGLFCEQALNGWVLAAVTWDDGTGEALYVAGEFTFAGCEVVNRIARWDGTSWSALAGPGGVGVDDDVNALAVFDDGSGPALYVGGLFTNAGGVTVNRIARWDGSNWSALAGPSVVGMNVSPTSYVNAMAVFDDGSGPALYAGGTFTSAGGVPVNRIAKWDGSTWSALAGPGGVGVDSSIRAMAVFDDGSGPALYAGGTFTSAGGVPVNRIAKWDGSTWSALAGPGGVGMSNSVYALKVFDNGAGPGLYAGGDFVTAGGVTVNRIARWDGSHWSALTAPSGVGTGDYVISLAVFDDGSGPALYAGGVFVTAGGVAVNRIAKWDGSTWSALAGPDGVGANADVRALAVFDDGSGPALYVGGLFTTAGGRFVDYIARWDGASWSPLAIPGASGVNGSIISFASFDDGSGPALYAGGHFDKAGGVTVNRIAKWDGSTWSALTGPGYVGLHDTVYALAVYDDGSGSALYAGGRFFTIGGVSVKGIARWDGASWSALAGPAGVGVGSGAPTSVDAIAVFDDGTGPALYAAGSFTTAGGVVANNIARWNGSTWSTLAGPSGVGVNNRVSALAVFDDGSGPALYAGGSFTNAGGVTVNRIAKWDGNRWSALANSSSVGVNNRVSALAVFDDGSGPALYAGGSFTNAGGVTVNRVAKWNGSMWSALSGPSGVGISGTSSSTSVSSLTTHDDGSGPALYAGGYFTTAGGVTVNCVAKWNGATWSALSGPGGAGMGVESFSPVIALTPHGDGSGPALYAGGGFDTAGGVVSKNIAKWQGCTPPECPPDVNDDGEVDILDFLDFIDSFGTCEAMPAPCAGTSGVSADYNGDTLVDILDLLDFLDAFGTGCE